APPPVAPHPRGGPPGALLPRRRRGARRHDGCPRHGTGRPAPARARWRWPRASALARRSLARSAGSSGGAMAGCGLAEAIAIRLVAGIGLESSILAAGAKSVGHASRDRD